MVEQLTQKADFVPVLRQKLAGLKRDQEHRERQLDRLLDLVAGTSELQTFLAELNDLGRIHNVAITTTKPGPLERFPKPTPAQAKGQSAPPAAGGGGSRQASGDPLLNRGLEKRSAALTVTAPFQQVLAFLRALEQLEVFVVISERMSRQSAQTQDAVGVWVDPRCHWAADTATAALTDGLSVRRFGCHVLTGIIAIFDGYR